jgi:hypothetical protein
VRMPIRPFDTLYLEPDQAERVLVVTTFRKRPAVAAYLYLPRRGAEHAAWLSKASPGLIDLAQL